MRRFAGCVEVSSYRAQAALLHINLASLRGLLHDPAPPQDPDRVPSRTHRSQPPGFIVVLRLFCRRLV